MKRYAFITLFAISMFAQDAKAEWVSAEASYLIGREISESEACQRAERRAKEDALKQVTGEKISSEDNQVCFEDGSAAECSLNRYTWSTIDGLITDTKNMSVKTVPGVSGFQQCVVSLQVDVGVGIGEPDPNFDMRIEINRPTFRDGEDLKITLTPTQPMYVNVFQFLPYMKADKQVLRIFPNPYDKQSLFKEKGTIPTPAGTQKYDMTVGFPEGLKSRKKIKMIDEYLMVLGTKEPISFLDAYSREDFNARVLEIPQKVRRIYKRAYNVVKPK